MKLCEHLITKLMIFCLIVGVVLLSGAPPVAAANVNIPDATLRGTINSHLRRQLGANRAWNAAVTEAEMKTLTTLWADRPPESRSPIRDLTGLEKATNLTYLDLGGNAISNISALSGLTKLTTLKLGMNIVHPDGSYLYFPDLAEYPPFSNSVSDLTPLSRLTKLTTLDLRLNAVRDISALSGLTNLTTLYLGNYGLDLNWESNLLSAGRTLAPGFFERATFNIISNLSALSGLTKLTTLDLTNLSGTTYSGTGLVPNISALSRLTNLTHLYLGKNTISDISALSGLTNLKTLDLRQTDISDISSLVSNTGLGTGDKVALGYGKGALLGSTAFSIVGSWQSVRYRERLSYPSIYTHIPALQTRGVTVTFTNRTPTTLTKVSGDAQTGVTSTALASPFVVEVKDGATTAQTFEGVPVTFAVTGGGGTLSATSVATDANGRAQVTLTPGATATTQTVTATVTHAGKTLTQTFSTTVNVPPTFNSAATFSAAENTTAVGTVTATDANSADSVTGYTITGGADSAKFSITTAGALTFAAAPNYEAPGDLVSTTPANAADNNQYILVVTATSGTGARQATTLQTLTITVTDVNEPPGKPGTPTVTAAATTPTSLNVSWTAPPNAGKPAITAYNLRYRKSSETNWTSSTYAGTETNTTLTGLTPGTTYDVQVLAKNHEGDSPWSNSGSATTSTNAVPTFTSAATFSIAENATAVGTVVATDADTTDNVTGYTITAGADSSKFAITNAGVLTFVAAPDYDDPGDALSTDPANAAGNNEYLIVVTATSGTAARVQTATQTLTITVTNVPPPGKPAAPTVTVASHTSLTATWTAPTNTGPAIRGYDVQYRKGTTGNFTDWPHTGTAVTTTITGLTAGTSYQVQVRAGSPEGEGPWSDASAATTTYQAEDVDSSGDVDIDDLVAVVENFGSSTPGRNDVDGDGNVDAADIRRVFNAVLAAEAAAGAPALTHTAKTLQHYLQQTKARGVGANFQRGLAVLEELLEPFLIPDASSLLHNYPNPFNPETWIPYQLAKSSDVTFSIYSVNGTLIRTLSLGYQAAGVYRSKSRAAYWDGRNALGEPVASGVYFYTLTASDFIATGKMLIRK